MQLLACGRELGAARRERDPARRAREEALSELLFRRRMRAPNAAGESAALRAAKRKFACVAAARSNGAIRDREAQPRSVRSLPAALRGLRSVAMANTEPLRRQFASDNYAGICPEAWQALERANRALAKLRR
jgi:hypothetical protein